MLSDDLYKNKYLKYKNKYLNLKSQVGGNDIDEEYLEGLIKYLLYTEWIFHYLDKFYQLRDDDTNANTIKKTLKFRINQIIGQLVSYNQDLQQFKQLMIGGISKLTNLTKYTMIFDIKERINVLDSFKPPNQYEEYINNILTNLNTMVRAIDNLDKHFTIDNVELININISLFITLLRSELIKIEQVRSSLPKRLIVLRETKEERLMRKFDTLSKRQVPGSAETSLDYGTNPLN